MRETYMKLFERSNLNEEEIEKASCWTLGDLIVHGGLTLQEATQFRNFLVLEIRRHNDVSLRVNKPLKESVSIILERDSACKMAGLMGTSAVDNVVMGIAGMLGSAEEGEASEQMSMVLGNLQSIASKAQSLKDKLTGLAGDVPEWVQEKIAVADAMIDTISDYLEYTHDND